MLSRLELCGNKRDWLAEVDAECAGDILRLYNDDGQRDQYAIVRHPLYVLRAVDEDSRASRHWPWGRQDPRQTSIPSLAVVVVILGTSSQSICCPANVEWEFDN